MNTFAPCRVCHKAADGHSAPQCVSEVVQKTTDRLRWLVSEDTGQLFGVEMRFTDGSRVRLSSLEIGEKMCIALAPSQFTDDRGAVAFAPES